MTTYVLMFLLWNANARSHFILTQEFTSRERCEDAALAAKVKFGGYGASPYWVCVPK